MIKYIITRNNNYIHIYVWSFYVELFEKFYTSLHYTLIKFCQNIFEKYFSNRRRGEYVHQQKVDNSTIWWPNFHFNLGNRLFFPILSLSVCHLDQYLIKRRKIFELWHDSSGGALQPLVHAFISIFQLNEYRCASRVGFPPKTNFRFFGWIIHSLVERFPRTKHPDTKALLAFIHASSVDRRHNEMSLFACLRGECFNRKWRTGRRTSVLRTLPVFVKKLSTSISCDIQASLSAGETYASAHVKCLYYMWSAFEVCSECNYKYIILFLILVWALNCVCI